MLDIYRYYGEPPDLPGLPETVGDFPEFSVVGLKESGLDPAEFIRVAKEFIQKYQPTQFLLQEAPENPTQPSVELVISSTDDRNDCLLTAYQTPPSASAGDDQRADLIPPSTDPFQNAEILRTLLADQLDPTIIISWINEVGDVYITIRKQRLPVVGHQFLSFKMSQPVVGLLFEHREGQQDRSVKLLVLPDNLNNLPHDTTESNQS